MKYGLIGEKLPHSFSKTVHGMLKDYTYDLIELKPDELDAFMKKRDFSAINVTIPYKKAVMPYLDYIDPKAKEIGAINTVVNDGGKLLGYNTDYLGMLSLIKKSGIEIKDKKVAILGTGGTSQTAKAVCKSLMVKEILTVSRNKSDGVITYSELYESHKDTDVIINTTPLGMYPDTESMPADLKKFDKLLGVVDVIYNPINTRLITEARDMGIRAVGGLYMLVAQAAYAAERFTDTKIPEGKIDKTFKELLKQKMNIVLIGMPSSGKSTIGRMSASSLSRDLIDTDKEIVERAHTEISEIFEMRGEEFFRDLEEEVIEDISRLSGKIIATGGGAILRESNIKRLKRNGVIVFIDRPLENLRPTSNRPLAKDFKLMEKRYGERYGKYLRYADIHLKTTQIKEENRDNLIRLFDDYLEEIL